MTAERGPQVRNLNQQIDTALQAAPR